MFKIINSKMGLTIDLKKHVQLNIYCLTDIHIGGEMFDKIALESVVRHIKNDKNGYCFLNGDNIEFIPPNYGISERGQELLNEDQVLQLIQLFEPIKHKILFIRGGNHDTERSINIAGCDITKLIAERLDIPYYPEPGYCSVLLKKGKFVLASGHGFSSGGNGDVELGKLKRIYPSADVYFLGHNHQLYVKRDDSLVLKDDGEKYKPQWLCRGGSFLKYASYARKRIMSPQPVGYVKITTNGLDTTCVAQVLE